MTSTVSLAVLSNTNYIYKLPKKEVQICDDPDSVMELRTPLAKSRLLGRTRRLHLYDEWQIPLAEKYGEEMLTYK